MAETNNNKQNRRKPDAKKRKRIPFHVKKEFQNLISWKLLYTRIGTPNKEAAEKIDEEIAKFKKLHKMEY